MTWQARLLTGESMTTDEPRRTSRVRRLVCGLLATSPPVRKRASIRGVTIVEVLVVIAVMSALMALLLPAVHQAREAARRLQCKSHMKQLGVALHAYASTHGGLPPGSVVGDWSWKTFLLPYVDQAAAYDTIDFSNNVRGGCYSCLNEVGRIAASGDPPIEQTFVPIYYCPSDPQSGSLFPDIDDPNYVYRLGSYLGISGNRYDSPAYGMCLTPNPPRITRDNGMLVYAYSVRLEHVVDGTSNTLMVGERGLGHVGPLHGHDFCARVFSPWMPMTGFQFPDQYAQKPTLYWSFHPGGGNFALGDGSVRFVSYQVEKSILSGLATANGNEVLGEF